MKKISHITVYLSTFICIILAALILTMYTNYTKQKKIIIQSHLDLEKNFIKEAARISKIWFDKRLQEKNSTIDIIEQEIFTKFIDPIRILKSGDAWIYNRDYVIFDKSSDFPEEYKGKSIREIFNIQNKYGASHYDNIIHAVENAGEGTGYYIWLPEKGREWTAWTSFSIAGQTWTIGLSTPEKEIMDSFNMRAFWIKQIIYACFIMTLLTALSILIIAYNKKRNILISELDKANSTLRELHRMKNDFIINISHDFRTPLTIISNLTELNLLNRSDLPREVTEDLNTINKTSLKFLSKINMLLDISKLENTGPKFKVSKINLQEFIDEIASYYRSSLKNTRISIETVFFNPVTEFYSDIEKIEEILNNLIANAIKFVDTNTGKISIELDKKDSYAIIRICDNGLGIEKNELAGIFNRFEQGKNANEIIYQGTGIGLSYSRQLAEILGGGIKAESPGRHKGAVLTVSLPEDKFTARDADITQEERRIKHRKPVIDLQPSGGAEESVSLQGTNRQNEFNPMKGIILVAEDDPHIRDIIIRYLKYEGYMNIISTSDGKRACELFNKYHPDMVIADFYMPGMTGGELLSAVTSKIDFPFIPFIFISAVTGDEIVLESKRRGISDFLFKPISREELITSVNTGMKKYYDFIRMAGTDELTRFSNRGFFLKSFGNIILSGITDVSLIIFDLDHFKTINDSFGHQAGDYVISSICSLVLRMIRNHDIAGRYGGEEFGIILPDTSVSRAAAVAEKIRSAIETLKMNYEGNPLNITASFGVSSLMQYEERTHLHPDSSNPEEEIIRMADTALYKAKSAACSSCSFSPEGGSGSGDVCSQCGGAMKQDRNRVEIFNDL